LGSIGIHIKKKYKFGAGEILVKIGGEFFPAGNTLVYQGGRNITVRDYQFPPGAALRNAVFFIEMLRTVCGKKVGYGLGF
jgi:hypothetical protein